MDPGKGSWKPRGDCKAKGATRPQTNRRRTRPRSTHRSKLSSSHGFPARDRRRTVWKPSRRLTGMRDVPGIFALQKREESVCRCSANLLLSLSGLSNPRLFLSRRVPAASQETKGHQKGNPQEIRTYQTQGWRALLIEHSAGRRPRQRCSSSVLLQTRTWPLSERQCPLKTPIPTACAAPANVGPPWLPRGPHMPASRG